MSREPASESAIVVSGLGAVTPLGLDAQTSFDALIEGQSGVGSVPFELHPDFECRIAAPVRDLTGDDVMGKRAARRYARFAHLALAAAREAAMNADLAHAGVAPERIAVIVGVGLGGLDVLYDCFSRMASGGPRAASPLDIPALIPNMASALLSMEFGARGPSYTISTACASGTHAIGEAFELLRRGQVDVVIAGGSEAILTPQGLAGFERLGALSRRNDAPERASRPFDRDRDGFVLGEGAGILVLERLEHARRRGAPLRCIVSGYGATSDAVHQTRPPDDGEGAARAIRSALASARIAPDAVEYVNAHGTSTLQNDVAETRALRAAFGAHADRLWISSNKSMIGHLMGAAGAVEAIFTALTLETGLVPPTINLEVPDPECDLDYVPHVARKRKLRTALSNSFGFGGHNAVLVLRSCS